MNNQLLFPGARRASRITTVQALRAANDERRLKLGVEIELSGGSLIGMPGWCHDAFTAIAKDESAMDAIRVDVGYRGMNINIHATDKSAKTGRLLNSMLSKFSILRKGKTDEPDIVLAFTAIVPMTAEAWAWAGEMIGRTTFFGFENTQQVLIGEDAEEQEDDEDDEDQMDLVDEARKKDLDPKEDAKWAKAHKPLKAKKGIGPGLGKRVN